MSSPLRRGGGLRGVRLGEIPMTVRERGKALAMKREDSPMERLRIGVAAERPSDRVYWVSATAYERVMGARP